MKRVNERQNMVCEGRQAGEGRELSDKREAMSFRVIVQFNMEYGTVFERNLKASSFFTGKRKQ